MNARPFVSRWAKAAASAALFVTGFVLLAFVADRAVGWYTERTAGRHLIGREVYVVQQRLRQTDPEVRAIFLGDSVSRQLFVPGEEPTPEIKYLTSNQAISMAGQYYLLQVAVERYPSLEEVLLFYTAGAWRNDLDQVYTHDYFCGYFHEPDQVAELFAVKHDWALLFAHLGRGLLPNLTALNSALSVVPARTRNAGGVPAFAEAGPVAEQPILLSHVSDEFLKRIRRLCAQRRLKLRVLPCPASDRFRFADVNELYDRPFLYLPSRLFRSDGVHVKDPFVHEVRIAVEQGLGLYRQGTADAPQQARTASVPDEALSRLATAAGSELSSQ